LQLTLLAIYDLPSTFYHFPDSKQKNTTEVHDGTENKMIKFLNSTFVIRQSSFQTVFALLLVCFLIVSHSAYASDAEINCDAHKGACSRSLGNHTVTLEITPRPVKAMQDLVFKVSISGKPPAKSPYIDLGMPGMKMGPNRVLLKPAGQGHYEGKGVIVRCPSGRRTWFSNVTIPEAGEVKFVFDVIY
jgi:hypothetical protein